MSEVKCSRDHTDKVLDLAAKGLLGSQVRPETEEAKKAIRNHKYFRYPDPFSVMTKRMLELAAEKMIEFAKPLRFLGGAKATIKRQPFFGQGQECTIKFRRPVPYNFEESNE